MITDVPVNDSSPRARPGELRLHPQIHGRSRVPGPEVTGFNLLDFTHAMEERDIDYQASRYAPEAAMLIIDPDNPPSAPQLLLGRPAIHAWLLHTDTCRLELRVTDLVDGGDRMGFTERWRHQDGTSAVATSTVEIDHGLLTMRHTILVWDHDLSWG
jgi:hypothetical protein